MAKANSPFKQPSNLVSRFSQAHITKKPRSSFPIRTTYKGQITDGGLLYPIRAFPVYPGDTWNFTPTIFVRLTTQIVPMMDNLYLDWFAFFVPNRLVDSRWEQIMGERKPDPDSSIDFTTPKLPGPASTGWAIGDMPEAYGIVPGIADGPVGICAYVFRGYNLIWRDWFRDGNLQDSPVVDLDAGPDTPADYKTILRRGKRHDQFTAATALPQKGTAVSVPLGGQVPITGFGKLTNIDGGFDNQAVYESDGSNPTYPFASVVNAATGNNAFFVRHSADGAGFPQVFADLDSVSGIDINDLRTSLAVQHLLEADNRGGSRYVEQLLVHFGVSSADQRLQRPEFLGGGSVPYNQQAVAQTTFQANETRLDAKGALAANSVFVATNRNITYSATEHGYIHLMCSVRADITYMQGVEKHFFMNSRYDFYYPEFANLSDEAILSREIYMDGTGSAVADPPTGDYSVFGYNERFYWLRQLPSAISGTLRSDAPSTLDFFHMAQDLGSRPTLSDTFIQDMPPIARTVGINPSISTPAFLYDCFLQGSMTRVMPAYGIPGLTRF
jgi:hypothetical protein